MGALNMCVESRVAGTGMEENTGLEAEVLPEVGDLVTGRCPGAEVLLSLQRPLGEKGRE